MKTSGRNARARRRTSRRSASNRGRCFTTSASPMTASSSAACHVSRPAARMRGPPTPANTAFGKRSRNAAMSPAPSRSPDVSPATSVKRGEPCSEKPGFGIRDSGSGGYMMRELPARFSDLATRRGYGQARDAWALRHPEFRIPNPGFSTPGASPHQRPLAAFDEIEHRRYVLTVRRDRCKLAARLGERAVAEVQRAVGALDRADARGIESAALQAFGIDPARPSVIGRHHYERRHVAVDETTHADERVRADAAELMHAGKTREDRVVADRHMAGE